LDKAKSKLQTMVDAIIDVAQLEEVRLNAQVIALCRMKKKSAEMDGNAIDMDQVKATTGASQREIPSFSHEEPMLLILGVEVVGVVSAKNGHVAIRTKWVIIGR